jgi:hypothetical protein
VALILNTSEIRGEGCGNLDDPGITWDYDDCIILYSWQTFAYG